MALAGSGVGVFEKWGSRFALAAVPGVSLFAQGSRQGRSRLAARMRCWGADRGLPTEGIDRARLGARADRLRLAVIGVGWLTVSQTTTTHTSATQQDVLHLCSVRQGRRPHVSPSMVLGLVT